MAKRRKRKDSADENVEAYMYETETRKNVVPAGLASYDTLTPKPKKYGYDPYLDPQLVWTGKAENTSLFIIRLEVGINGNA
ncbi:MAG: hypothetical protein QMD97_05245 [Candidatus Aenigmarchaeota archaeon]|nr:hypothetical protein [Candidatus Aenigmarchaeota archaeon]